MPLVKPFVKIENVVACPEAWDRLKRGGGGFSGGEVSAGTIGSNTGSFKP